MYQSADAHPGPSQAAKIKTFFTIIVKVFKLTASRMIEEL